MKERKTPAFLSSIFFVKQQKKEAYNFMHCLNAKQFDRSFLEEICKLADTIRLLNKDKQKADELATLLSHKRAILYFAQPSTRTFLSFQTACQILGIKTSDVRDTSTSSEVKGESEEDTVKTFASYFDLIIMRHHKAGFVDEIAKMLDLCMLPRSVPVINAGSGKDEHPTQALLDVYTLVRAFKGGIDNKHIAFVGDLKRGRTARSLSYLLTNFQNIKQYFVAPKTLQISKNVLNYLDKQNINYELTENFDSILPVVDAVYMTRTQSEWDKPNILDCNYSIDKNNLSLLHPRSVIMHPLPRKNEISPEVDSDTRAVYWQQARNGLWIRAALMAYVFEIGSQLL